MELSEYKLASDWVTVVKDRQPHNMFLSHSGAQKNFVEQLCEDLQRANQSPFFDKSPISLPKGEEYAPRIFTAITACKVAVVVVSDEYFTRSKWPMLELAAIVRAPECKIIPLFYGLSCKEFKDETRRERWFQVWHQWSMLDNRISVDEWKDALRSLGGLTGMDYVEATGEVSYRKDVVTNACDLLRRISQDEIMVVERATSNACELDLQYQSRTSAVTQFNNFKFACLQMTLPIVFQQVVAFITILLLITGYCNYFHNSKASPSDYHGPSDHNMSKASPSNYHGPSDHNMSKASPSNYHGPSDHNTSRLLFILNFAVFNLDNNYVDDFYLKLVNFTPHHLNGKYTTTPALTDIYNVKSKYGQQPVSCLEGLPKLISETNQICLDESLNLDRIIPNTGTMPKTSKCYFWECVSVPQCWTNFVKLPLFLIRRHWWEYMRAGEPKVV